jgi:hypothetical protein
MKNLICCRNKKNEITSVSLDGDRLEKDGSRYFLNREDADDIVLGPEHYDLALMVGYPIADTEEQHIGKNHGWDLVIYVNTGGALTVTIVYNWINPFHLCTDCAFRASIEMKILKLVGETLIQGGALLSADFFVNGDDYSLLFCFNSTSNKMSELLQQSDRIGEALTEAWRIINDEVKSLLETRANEHGQKIIATLKK